MVAVPALLLAAASTALAQGASQWVDPPPANAQSAPVPDSPNIRRPAPEPAATPPRRATLPKASPAESRRAVAEPEPEPAPKRRKQAKPAAKPAAPARTARSELPVRSGSIAAKPALRDIEEVAPRRRLARPPATGRVAHPSFNCRYARTAVEQAICADPLLAAKDRRMALLYERAGGSRFRPVDPTQWGWLAARNGCARARGALDACVHRAYDSRIAELSSF
jgi:hypothetical protein